LVVDNTTNEEKLHPVSEIADKLTREADEEADLMSVLDTTSSFIFTGIAS